MTSLQCVGIGFFVLAGIWGILFVNPKSPIRSRCWSVSSILGVTIIQRGVYSPKGNRQYLTIYKVLRTLSPIRVDKVSLCIGRKRIISFDWKSHVIEGDEPGYANFNRPEWLLNGNHSARLIVYTSKGYSKSERFALKVRD